MNSKVCSCCGQGKPVGEFQRRARSLDGLTASCKACLRERDHRRYPKEKARRAELMREYSKTDAGKLAIKRSCTNWRAKNQAKYKAHNMVNNAIRDGKLAPQPCGECGAKEGVHAHHDDYAKPLNVRWLCAAHHRQWHAEHGEAANP